MSNSYRQTHEVKQNEKTGEYLSNEQVKYLGGGGTKPNKKTKETKINNFSSKEFKEMVIRMVNKLKSGIWRLRENFKKELESIVKIQAHKMITITKMKTTLERINSRLANTEKCINDPEYKIVYMNETEH